MKAYRTRHRGIGVVLCAAAAIAAWPCVAGAGGPRDRDVARSEAEVRLGELFQDISTINLLNGLRLTSKQTQAVLALARKVEGLRRTSDAARACQDTVGKAIKAYEAFKAEANKGEPPGDRLSRYAVRYEHRVLAARADRARAADRYLADLDAKLQNVLTEGHVQIIETFEPCLVPPKDLKDPVRAGQVASDRGAKVLSRLRKIPAHVWRQRKEEMAERHLRMIEGDRIEITSDDARAAQKQSFIELVEKARAMSDVEFEMEKGELAKHLAPSHARKAMFKRAQVARPKGRPKQVSRSARWLLNPRIIPILEARLKSGKPFRGAPGASQAASR